MEASPRLDEDESAMGSRAVLEASAADRSRAHMRGYLKKRNRKDVWQRRFFEIVDHWFVYYKRSDSEDMLCAMDLYQADPPRLLYAPPGPDGRRAPTCEFALNYDRDRIFRAPTAEEAERWVTVMLAVQRANPAHSTIKPAEVASSRGPHSTGTEKSLNGGYTSSKGKSEGCCVTM